MRMTPRKGLPDLFYVSAGYLLLTLLMTYPLAWHLSSRLGGHDDVWQNIWNMWWMNRALTELHTNPYYTDMLFHPLGTTLLFHTFGPFNAFLSVPLQYLFGLITSYNLLVLLHFLMGGVGMYLLARHVVQNRWAAFVAGCIFTFSPYHFAHGRGHLDLIALEWIPFYILFLMRAVETQRARYALLGALFYVLTALCSWYYMLFISIFTVLFLLHRLCVHPSSILRRSTLKVLALVFIIAVVLLSPWVGPMVHTLRSADQSVGGHLPENYSADLYSFFVPNAISFYGKHFSSISSRWKGNPAENANYIGYVVLMLAFLGMPGLRKEKALWWVSALTFILLSLGPLLHVGGTILPAPSLPYGWLHSRSRILAISGVPERFNLMTYLCLGVLAAFGLKRMCQRLKHGNVWVGAFLALILLEYLPVPFQQRSFHVPEFYQQIASETADYAIFDLHSPAKAMYYQTAHQKTIVGGYISRTPKAVNQFYRAEPAFRGLFWPRYVYVHKLTRIDPVIDFDGQAFPSAPSYESPEFLVVWTGSLRIARDDFFTFYLRGTMGVRLWIDGQLVVQDWLGSAVQEVEATLFLREGWHSLKLEYYGHVRRAKVALLYSPPSIPKKLIPSDKLNPVGEGGLRGRYYGDQVFTRLLITRNDPVIGLNWSHGSPGPSLPPDRFSVAWDGQVKTDREDSYEFCVVSDDGVRLWINDNLLIDNWDSLGLRDSCASIVLHPGWHDIRMRYFEHEGRALAKLYWGCENKPREIIPSSHLRNPVHTQLAEVRGLWSDYYLKKYIVRVTKDMKEAWRSHNVRYIVVPTEKYYFAFAKGAELTQAYQGDDMVVYEVTPPSN